MIYLFDTIIFLIIYHFIYVFFFSLMEDLRLTKRFALAFLVIIQSLGSHHGLVSFSYPL